MYPEGMLDRDQRTAKISLHRHRCSDNNIVPNRTNSITISSFKATSSTFNSIITRLVSRRKTSKCSYFMWKKGYLIPKFQRLKNVLLVIVYLMLTILPTTQSAPSTMNPSSMKTRKVCTAKMLNTFLTQVNVSLLSARELQGNFKEYTNWVRDSTVIEWIPDIGKKINESLSEDVLNTLEVDSALETIYNNLRGMSLILESVHRELNGNPHYHDFRKLRSTNSQLSEVLKNVMESRGIKPNDDVTDGFSILPENVVQAFQSGDITSTTAYVTIIFRECVNNYQYAQQVLQHFLNDMEEQNGCS